MVDSGPLRELLVAPRQEIVMKRHARGPIGLHRAVATAAGIAIAFAFALAASAPVLAGEHANQTSGQTAIELGEDDLGKSREELGDRSVVEPDRPSPKHHEHGECNARQYNERDCQKKGCKHAGGGCKKCHRSKHAHRHGVHGYEKCVERAARAGIALEESSRVCRAVFPEKPYPRQGENQDEKQ